MQIKSNVIELLNTRDNRFALATALDTSEVSIRRYLKENKVDGDLTKITALNSILKITGFTSNDDILTESVDEQNFINNKTTA